jgi:hypothetical protein
LDWVSLLVGIALTALRGRHALLAENLLLRQQLAVALRPRRRLRLRWHDRLCWVVARRLVTDWRRHLVLVQPETVLRWHRRGWRLVWWWRSGRPTGRPRVPQEVRALIRRLSEENRLWGTERLRAKGKPAMVIIVAVMRTLLLLAWTLLRTGRPVAATVPSRPRKRADDAGQPCPPLPPSATAQPART